jgi:hypothetical protein
MTSDQCCFPDSGHWIYEEHPAESTKLFLGFLG